MRILHPIPIDGRFLCAKGSPMSIFPISRRSTVCRSASLPANPRGIHGSSSRNRTKYDRKIARRWARTLLLGEQQKRIRGSAAEINIGSDDVAKQRGSLRLFPRPSITRRIRRQTRYARSCLFPPGQPSWSPGRPWTNKQTITRETFGIQSLAAATSLFFPLPSNVCWKRVARSFR